MLSHVSVCNGASQQQHAYGALVSEDGYACRHGQPGCEALTGMGVPRRLGFAVDALYGLLLLVWSQQHAWGF